jgi:hypothetical protein
MRSKVIFAMLVGLLFCSLATLEITELLELADYTSNDFSLLGTQRAPSAVVRQSVELGRKASPTREGSNRPRVRRQFVSASYGAKDFFHLLFIMRT